MRLFIIKIKTTGCKGMPMHHDLHRVIEIDCLDIKTKDVFNELANPNYESNEGIPPESVKYNNISIQDIENVYAPSHTDVVVEFKNWVNELCINKEPAVFLSHHARFDKTMILKTLKDVTHYGRDGKDLNWYFFDTTAAFKDLYPDLAMDCFSPKENAYSIKSLYGHFFSGDEIESVYSTQLWYLFDQYILPKIEKDFMATTWKQNKYLLENKNLSRTEKLMDIPGLWNTRVKYIVKSINNEFNHEPFTQLKTTIEIAHLGHLIAYGKSKYTRGVEKKCGEWAYILKEVELLLRKHKVSNDSELVHILSRVAGITELELVYHTMDAHGNKNIFPSSPTSPTSYLPLKVSKEEAGKLYNKLGLTSVSDIIAKFLCCPSSKDREEFIRVILYEALNVDTRELFEHKFYTLF